MTLLEWLTGAYPSTEELVPPERMADMRPGKPDQDPMPTSLAAFKAQDRRLSAFIRVLGFVSLVNLIAVFLVAVKFFTAPSLISILFGPLLLVTFVGLKVLQHNARAEKLKLAGDQARAFELEEATAQRELMECAPDLADSLRSHLRED